MAAAGSSSSSGDAVSDTVLLAAVSAANSSSEISPAAFAHVQEKTEAVARLVGLLEETRRADDNSFEKQLERLKKEKEQKRKEERDEMDVSIAGGRYFFNE